MLLGPRGARTPGGQAACGRGLRARADVRAYLRARIRSLKKKKKITAGNNVVPKIETSTGREAGSRWHLRLLRSPPRGPPDNQQAAWVGVRLQPSPRGHKRTGWMFRGRGKEIGGPPFPSLTPPALFFPSPCLPTSLLFVIAPQPPPHTMPSASFITLSRAPPSPTPVPISSFPSPH